MTVNTPTLPLWNAVQTTLATVVSVGLALIPGQMVGEHLGALITLSLDGLVMVAVLWVVTQATAQRIIAALPNDEMCHFFEAAEPVQLLTRLTG